jgi:hypothetical protein
MYFLQSAEIKQGQLGTQNNFLLYIQTEYVQNVGSKFLPIEVIERE